MPDACFPGVILDLKNANRTFSESLLRLEKTLRVFPR